MKESTKKALIIGGCVFAGFCVFSVVVSLLFGEYPTDTDTAGYESKYESGTTQAEIESLVSKYASKTLDDVSVSKITINEHMGTDDANDYIVLAYLNWDKKYVSNFSAKDTLSDYCTKFAEYIGAERSDAQEFAIFWTIPYLDNEQTKCNYKRDDNGMQIYDATGILNGLKMAKSAKGYSSSEN